VTTAVLIRTLEHELEALLTGEEAACLVCGEPVELDGGRVECGACGSRIETGATI
jgi:Zn finger protein HypA/HybF involved in hydrogenase expression